MRYQEWWFWKLPKEFKKAGFDVHVLGENAVTYMKAADGGMFSPVESAIDLETAQIKEYTALKLRDDDILFLADLSFPGLFGNVLFHKRPKRCFAYCHATSKNKLDYFNQLAFMNPKILPFTNFAPCGLLSTKPASPCRTESASRNLVCGFADSAWMNCHNLSMSSKATCL